MLSESFGNFYPSTALKNTPSIAAIHCGGVSAGKVASQSAENRTETLSPVGVLGVERFIKAVSSTAAEKVASQ